MAASKGRKFDRNRKSPAMAAYKAQSRDQVNKKKRMAKHAKAVAAKQATATVRVIHGAARDERRQNDPLVQERAQAYR